MEPAYEMGSESEVTVTVPSGVVVAALLAAAVGLLVLGIANIWADLGAGNSDLLKLNSGIGPYSGKEALMLAGWFGSWMALHFAFRRKELNVKKWFGAFLVLLLVAVLLVWPPLFEAIADALKGSA